MTRALASLALAGLALLAPACGEDGGGPGSAAEGETIVYAQGGGIDGRLTELRIEPDGRARLESNLIPAEAVSYSVGERRMAELRDAVAETPFESIDAAIDEDAPPQCADCLSYSVTVGERGITLDDLQRDTEAGEQADPVLGVLARILADAPIKQPL